MTGALMFRRLALLALLMILPLVTSTATWAQGSGAILPDTMIQWGDYDQFQVPGGPRGVRACGEACANDPRCKAWTFIKPVGQCRLKFQAGPAVPNPCCVSGKKPEAAAAETGGKQAFCADYANRAVSAQDQNLREACRFTGPRWGVQFQDHYSWCMGVDRNQSQVETNARTADLARCTVAANDGSEAKCEHYARVSTVQIETARKANCNLPQGDRLWVGDLARLKESCRRAPARVLPSDIDQREGVLSACFASAGQAQQACATYADVAVKQVADASAKACGFSGRAWTSSRAQHVQWCLSANPAARKAETDARAGQLAQCTQEAARRKACEQYAVGAVQQSHRNDTQECGFQGPNWSRYQDDHAAFCMSAGADQLRRETSARDAALRTCQARDYVNPECDEYAKRSVRLSTISRDRQCDNEGEFWSLKYADHYQFCTEANPQGRRNSMMLRREALRECSGSRGFRLELGF